MVADNFEPWRSFVSSMLGGESALEIVCEVVDGPAAVGKAEEMHPDLVLLDIGLPRLNGIEAADRIQQIALGSRILFVSQESDPDLVRAALSAGGRGYVLKADAVDELLPAITAVLRGDQFLSSGLKGMSSSADTGS
ncbi:MAG TPA: response regulator transcription factor [Terriglobales bacterium]|nr:response regulator transcription factor [Terriglobales bacterium]